MSKNYLRSYFLLTGFLLLLVTASLFFTLTEPVQRTKTLWWVMSGVFLSEVLLTLSWGDAAGRHDDYSYWYRVLVIIISFCYFAFSLIMFIPFVLDASTKAVFCSEIIGLFVAILSYIMSIIAIKSSRNKAEIFYELSSCKKRWYSQLSPLRSDISALYYSGLNEKFDDLLDEIRYAPEGRGYHQYDEEISSQISLLQKEILEKNSELVFTMIPQIVRDLRARKENIKLERKSWRNQ